MKLLIVTLLITMSLGCYSARSTTPPTAGTKPVISQLNPPSTAAGSSQFTLQVTGSNFNSNATVSFNGATMSTQWMNSTQVVATIPAAAVASSATVPVTVTNPGTPGGIYGGGTQAATSAAANFTIN